MDIWSIPLYVAAIGGKCAIEILLCQRSFWYEFWDFFR